MKKWDDNVALINILCWEGIRILKVSIQNRGQFFFLCVCVCICVCVCVCVS